MANLPDYPLRAWKPLWILRATLQLSYSIAPGWNCYALAVASWDEYTVEVFKAHETQIWIDAYEREVLNVVVGFYSFSLVVYH
jgi:hypothetical protein